LVRPGFRRTPSPSRSSRRIPRAALLAGCAGHSIPTADASADPPPVGMVFALTGHVVDWPCAQGGSHEITKSLRFVLRFHSAASSSASGGSSISASSRIAGGPLRYIAGTAD
jgi:hypothetical protein